MALVVGVPAENNHGNIVYLSDFSKYNYDDYIYKQLLLNKASYNIVYK
jgi:hypothetical protein